MTQQFTIQSEAIRDKLNSLLPSQNLGSIGVELTGSTTIIPVVDLTEIAEGSSLRQDLQTASSFSSTLSTATNTTTTVLTTTGYFRLIGAYVMDQNNNGSTDVSIFLDDGTTQKTIFKQNAATNVAPSGIMQGTFDLIVFLSAGKELKIKGTGQKATINCSSHQIADVNGNLTNPT